MTRRSTRKRKCFKSGENSSPPKEKKRATTSEQATLRKEKSPQKQLDDYSEIQKVKSDKLSETDVVSKSESPTKSCKSKNEPSHPISSSDSSENESESGLNLEEQLLYQKLKMKKNNLQRLNTKKSLLDNVETASTSCKPGSKKKSNQLSPKTDHANKQPSHKPDANQTINSENAENKTKDKLLIEKDENDGVEIEEKKKKRYQRKSLDAYIKEPPLTEPMFLKTKDDENVEELIEGSGVWIDTGAWTDIKRQGTTTAVARVTMGKVFTKEALTTCSLMGKPSKSKGSEKMSIRTALDPGGVKTIIAYAKAREKQKGFAVKTEKDIHQAMSSKLVEYRN